MDHLCGLGHRRIAYIAGPKLSSTARERLANFRLGMAARGLEVEDRMVVQGNYNIDAGIAAARQLLSLTPIPTAVISASDFAAVGVITHCQEIGVRVPEHISVVGFDDAFNVQTDMLYPLTVQCITTVDQPKRALGRAAGQLLLERISDPQSQLKAVVLATTLKVRHTT
ncbi:substrate-binding domain-containing protein, partial [Tianweitania sp.]|uniref:substrate-binding domain-containing protein n=1 Tax=Tianweitania sp. TaxID=2021634 RepID=UPI00289F328A